MEPRIQYAKTEDGVNIAYSVIGNGPPLVRIPGWLSHLEMEWNIPPIRQLLERWAKHFTLVRLDKRGTGLSDRDQPHDLNARISDIEAVVDHLGLSAVSLLGYSEGGPASIGFAARHPERVTRMALYGTWARGEALYGGAEVRNAVMAVVKAEWGMGSKLLTELFTGDEGDSEVGKMFTLRQRFGANASDAYRILEEDSRFDLTGLLAQITAPTLIVHARDDRVVPLELGREVAVGIPGARITLIDGPHLGDFEMLAEIDRIMLEFMTGEEVAKESKVTRAVGDTHTILFTDMEGSTTLADRLGDAAAQDVRRAHNDIVRAALAANAGSEIKHTGDGIMASFSTASSALDAAIAIQRGVAAHKNEHPDSPLGVYVGLNAGEPIAEDDPGGRVDLFGTSVNLAARICDHAEAGQIVAANVVRELAAGKQFLFADLGETALRGFEDPVKLWELRWKEDD